MNLPDHIEVNSMILMYIILIVIFGFAIHYLRKIDKDKRNTYGIMDLIVSEEIGRAHV